MKKKSDAPKTTKGKAAKDAMPEAVAVVIAMALNEALLGDCDTEPRKLTIRRGSVSGAWALKTNLMRTLPIREY